MSDTKRAKIQEVCATCKHFRMISFTEYRNQVSMCNRNCFDDFGRRICKWENAE